MVYSLRQVSHIPGCLHLQRVRTTYVVYVIFPILGGKVVVGLSSSCESFDFSDPFCILGLTLRKAEMISGILEQTLPWT